MLRGGKDPRVLNVDVGRHYIRTGGSNMEHVITGARRIQPQDYDAFVGMDVDKRSIVLTQIDHVGLEKQTRMPYDSGVLLRYVENHLGNKRVAFVYEAGPTGWGLYDDISSAGHRCLVVSPSSVPTQRGKRVRTNRLDSRKLALQLRGGSLESVRVPSEEYRCLREYVTLRKMHMTESAKCKQRIKALFLRNGLKFPGGTPGGYWSQELIGQIREYDCDSALRFKLGSLLDSMLFSRYQAFQAQSSMRKFVDGSPEMKESVELAMSLPGIGWIVGTYAVARIGDWRLLGRSSETASFFGLVQTEDSTGDSSDRGSITKSGDPVMRSLLIEAAWTAIRRDPDLREFYDRIYRTHSKDKAARIAIVAVARKHVMRLHCVLKERRRYQIRS
jgi:transposase